MDDRALMAAIDMAIDTIMRRHYETEAERDAALSEAMRELDVD